VRSFTDPETHFRLLREEQPVGDGGLTAEVPTGEVRCCECGRVAGDVDYIPHREGCSQADVRSRWYADTHPRLVQDN